MATSAVVRDLEDLVFLGGERFDFQQQEERYPENLGNLGDTNEEEGEKEEEEEEVSGEAGHRGGLGRWYRRSWSTQEHAPLDFDETGGNRLAVGRQDKRHFLVNAPAMNRGSESCSSGRAVVGGGRRNNNDKSFPSTTLEEEEEEEDLDEVERRGHWRLNRLALAAAKEFTPFGFHEWSQASKEDGGSTGEENVTHEENTTPRENEVQSAVAVVRVGDGWWEVNENLNDVFLRENKAKLLLQNKNTDDDDDDGDDDDDDDEGQTKGTLTRMRLGSLNEWLFGSRTNVAASRGEEVVNDWQYYIY